MIVIDGSLYEGGGQMLRTALALSVVTGQPFRMVNVRAGREKPGLKNQHLTVLRALSEVCGAEVEGDNLGSTEVVFKPGEIRRGSYSFDVGTAGSVTLVAQALLPVMIWFGDLEVEIRGGTHVDRAPTYEYLAHVLVENLRKFGADIDISLLRPGFYPKGGGRIALRAGKSGMGPVDMAEPGHLHSRRAIIVSSSLPEHVAEREARYIRKNWDPMAKVEVNTYDLEPGNAVTCISIHENFIIGSSSVGKRGKPAERVAKEAVDVVKEAEASGGVDRFMSDQVLPFLALFGGRANVTIVTNHTLSNLYVIEKFGLKLKQNKTLMTPQNRSYYKLRRMP